MAREIRPTYPKLRGKKLDACRAKGFAAMTKAERHAYGTAVEVAIRSLQHRELMTGHNCRIDTTPAAVKYAAAIAEKRAG
jgi:hypothetical protein